MIRRALISSLVLVLCALPLSAGAHASPVEYSPQPSAELLQMPEEVLVRFSERVDMGASFMRVEGADGIVSQKATAGEDAWTLVAPVSGGEGEYTVKWGVVSLDDGHFTRGEFVFGVGVAAASQAAPSFEMITLTTRAEALAMTVELLGHGILWALLVLFAIGLRPLLPAFGAERPLLLRGYLLLGWCGLALALFGEALQFYIKATDLAALQEVGFFDALSAYASTGAGSATLFRSLAAALFAGLFFWSGKRIFLSPRLTLYEGGLALLLLAFAYFRAVVSHATANPFLPELSIAVNFLHRIEKDLWVGVALAFFLIVLSPRLQRVAQTLVPRLSAILSATLALVAATAGYIIWLHLEGLHNLLSTTWGESLIPLLIAALLLVAARSWGVFVRHTPLLAGAEFALALVVLYRSNVVILTFPPLHGERHFDLFAFLVVGIVVAGFAYATFLYFASTRAAYSSAGKFSAFWGALGAFSVVAVLTFLLPFFGVENAFRKQCLLDGNMWHFMPPTRAGVALSAVSQEGCMWGMGAYPYHFVDREEYAQYRALGEADVEMKRVGQELTVTLTSAEGKPAELFVDMEKRLHIIIVSRDQSEFAHIHAESEPQPSVFVARYPFRKDGEYLVSVDYAHGLRQYSKQFVVDGNGSGAQAPQPHLYASPGIFEGYRVDLSHDFLEAGEVATLLYSIEKDGRSVQNLEPYLSAAMHLSAVKDDLSAFVHAHGELHDPSASLPPVRVVDGRVVHGHLPLPPSFSSPVSAHLIFPTPGIYTVWGEFSVEGRVIPTAFSVRVQ